MLPSLGPSVCLQQTDADVAPILPSTTSSRPSSHLPPSHLSNPCSTYINPKATGKDIIRMSRYMIVGFGLFMGVLAIILFKIGLSLGWVYLFMGIAIGGAVAPIYSALVWSKATATGAITGAISGTVLGLVVWLGVCQAYYGKINVDNLGGNYPMLSGNLVAIFSSLIIMGIISFMKPQNYDWKTTREVSELRQL